MEGSEADREEHQEAVVEEGVGVSLSYWSGNLRGWIPNLLQGLHTKSNTDGL